MASDTEEKVSSEATPEHRDNDSSEVEETQLRRSAREINPPKWHSDFVIENNVAYCLLTEDNEPSTFEEAINGPEASQWTTAIQEEVEALHKNKT